MWNPDTDPKPGGPTLSLTALGVLAAAVLWWLIWPALGPVASWAWWLAQHWYI